MTKKLFTIGEPMVVYSSNEADTPLRDSLSFSKDSAGAELNVATGIARLGLDVDYVCAVGNDHHGDYLYNTALKENIDVRHFVRSNQHNTGIYFKELVTKGDPEVFYLRKSSASANFDINYLDNIDFGSYSHAHLSGIFPAISSNAQKVFNEAVSRLVDNNVYITFDPNLRPSLWQTKEEMIEVTNRCALDADVVLPGISEGDILVGSKDPEYIADFYLNQSERTKLVIVKLGSKGAYYGTKDGAKGIVDGYKANKVVSTVGAGDGFAVGYISGKMDGLEDCDAIRRACIIGSLAVQTPGDNDGYPNREELLKIDNS